MLLITDGLPRGLGYIEVDQRAVEAPLPPGTARHFEADTYTCTHCTSVVVMNPLRKRERYKCKGCSHHICDECAAEMTAGAACKTMAQKIEEQMEQVSRQTGSSSILLP